MDGLDDGDLRFLSTVLVPRQIKNKNRRYLHKEMRVGRGKRRREISKYWGSEAAQTRQSDRQSVLRASLLERGFDGTLIKSGAIKFEILIRRHAVIRSFGEDAD